MFVAEPQRGGSKPFRGDLLKTPTKPSAVTRMITSIHLSKAVQKCLVYITRCISYVLYPCCTACDACASVSWLPLQEHLRGEHAPGEAAGHQKLPEAESAFPGEDDEDNGRVGNGTWTFDEVISSEDLLARCKKNKEPINIASLMRILSDKHWETPGLQTQSSDCFPGRQPE